MAALTEIENYYDQNTESFERFGEGGDAIRRAVWGAGVRSRVDAFRYVDRLILEQIELLGVRSGSPLNILDLGCGVGSSLLFLASQVPIIGTGVTLSGVQARAAMKRSADAGLSDRLSFIRADFHALPQAMAPAQLAFSIEAFAHSSNALGYFSAASRCLVPGGLLIVCDDFLTEQAEAGSVSQKARRLLNEVRTGWLVDSLVRTEAADEMAARAGFRRRSNLNLTPLLELRRSRDRLITLLVALGRHFPISGYRWRSLVGGNALQLALSSGLMEYRLLVWEKN